MIESILAAVAALCALIDSSATEQVVSLVSDGIDTLRKIWQAQGLDPDEFDRRVLEARTARETEAARQRAEELASK